MFGWVVLQSEIMAEPERFVEPDAELPLALLDQKEVYKHSPFLLDSVSVSFIYLFINYILFQAGKRLLLITNSDYHYTNKMMHHAFNRYLPNDMHWRDLFDMVRDCYQKTFDITNCYLLLVFTCFT